MTFHGRAPHKFWPARNCKIEPRFAFPDRVQNGAEDTATVQYLMRNCKLVLGVPVAIGLVISDTERSLSKGACIVLGIYRINETLANRSGLLEKAKSKPFRDSNSSLTASKSSRVLQLNPISSGLTGKRCGVLVSWRGRR